jgi:crotonobetainyl-CoA:carnitine CoA-transferase CaiB-like acyl-CoA transferase
VSSGPTAEPVLDGIRVLSVAEQYPGPYATLVLADLGADVVQVERPDGDPSRAFAGFYDSLNRNKRSVVLDLKDPEGVERFLDLAESADVVLEGFRPGTVERLGIGFEAVAARNPQVVYVAISGYGQDGPLRDHPNHDVAYQAAAGMLFEQARRWMAGPAPAVQVGDAVTGVFAFGATLLGLLHRARTGQGLYVDVAMLDVLVSMMSPALCIVANASGSPTFLQEGPGYRTYPTADGGLVALGIAHEDKFWRALCAVVGLDGHAALTHDERVARSDELAAVLTQAFAGHPRDHWIRRLTAAAVPCAPVYDLGEVPHDPQVMARSLVVSLPDDGGCARQYVRQPLVPRGHAYWPTSATPGLGEHSQAVLCEWVRSSDGRR